jgi:hypothetical protein
MSSRDRGVSLIAVSLAALLCLTAAAEPKTRHIVMLSMTVTLDQVSEERSKAAGAKIGDVDRLRLVYDANAVDPGTHRVALLNFQHFIGGQFTPVKPDPKMMPLDDAWLDVGARPYRLHFRAAVVHGDAIIIEADENTQRLVIHPQRQPDQIIIAGPYAIDSTPTSGHDADVAGTP